MTKYKSKNTESLKIAKKKINTKVFITGQKSSLSILLKTHDDGRKPIAIGHLSD